MIYKVHTRQLDGQMRNYCSGLMDTHQIKKGSAMKQGPFSEIFPKIGPAMKGVNGT